MSFVPQVVLPEDRLMHLADLRYPEDAQKIKSLTLAQLQVWYAAQDPHEMVRANSDFHAFWARNYVFPLKIKRFIYKFKFW